MSNLSETTKNRLYQLCKHFEQEPRRLDMSCWVSPEALVSCLVEHMQPACKTIGCISGWAQILFLGKTAQTVSTEAEQYNSNLQVVYGAEALCMPEPEPVRNSPYSVYDHLLGKERGVNRRAHKLFYVHAWPAKYAYCYSQLQRELKSYDSLVNVLIAQKRQHINIFIMQKLADVTIERIQFFINTDGDDDCCN